MTFEVKNLPESLKTYDFFLSSTNDHQQVAPPVSQRPPSSSAPPPPSFLADAVSINTECLTDTVSTTMTSLSTGRLVDLDDVTVTNGAPLVLPDPPSEDPCEDENTRKSLNKSVRPKSKLKQLKEKFKRNKKSAEFADF